MTNAMIAYENVTMVTAKKPTEFADGVWYAVTNVVSRTDSLPVNGSAHLILCDGATLAITNTSSAAAISVDGDAALTIYGQEADSGSLEVRGGSYSAGIGGTMNGTCGEIAIHGGTVKVRGGTFGTGIGSAPNGHGGLVTITGGRIAAIGNSEAADIGNAKSVTTPCEVAIRGGIFALGDKKQNELKGEWMAPGYEAVANTDETTKVEYPWAVLDNRHVILPGDVLGPYPTAAEATNVMAGSIFAPSAAIIAKLGADSSALRAYSEKFRIGVVPQSDGQWTVEALLNPESWTNVVESALEMTRQIPLDEIREFEVGVPFSLTCWWGVPGFYYSFYSGSVVTNVLAIASEDGRNVLCGTDEEVTFSGVTKPSDAAGFFSIGVKETGGVTPSDRPTVKLEPPAITDVKTTAD